MTYNIHACIGNDRRTMPDRVAEVIAQAGPDLVALQEVDHGRRRTRNSHQAREIAECLEMDHHFHPTLEFDDGRYGNAILSRFPLRVVRADRLSRPYPVLPLEPRAAIWAAVDVGGLTVHFLNTHLGLVPGERLQQVRDLLGPGWLGHPDCTGPTVLCGDMNFTPRSPGHRRLRTHLRDTHQEVPAGQRANTYPSYLPVTRLDHVFVSREVRVRAVEVPVTPLTRIASDHLPVVVDLDVAQEETLPPRTGGA